MLVPGQLLLLTMLEFLAFSVHSLTVAAHVCIWPQNSGDDDDDAFVDSLQKWYLAGKAINTGHLANDNHDC